MPTSGCEASSQRTVLFVPFRLVGMDDDIGVETDFGISCVDGCETDIEFNESVVPLLMDMDKRRASRSACSIDKVGKRFIAGIPVVCLTAARWFGGPRLSVGFVSHLFGGSCSGVTVMVAVVSFGRGCVYGRGCVHGRRRFSPSPKSFAAMRRPVPDRQPLPLPGIESDFQ